MAKIKKVSKSTSFEVFKGSIKFIELLEKYSGKEPSEIYKVFKRTRQYYSFLKTGRKRITAETMKTYRAKALKLGLSDESYAEICTASVMASLSDK